MNNSHCVSSTLNFFVTADRSGFVVLYYFLACVYTSLYECDVLVRA